VPRISDRIAFGECSDAVGAATPARDDAPTPG